MMGENRGEVGIRGRQRSRKKFLICGIIKGGRAKTLCRFLMGVEANREFLERRLIFWNIFSESCGVSLNFWDFGCFQIQSLYNFLLFEGL